MLSNSSQDWFTAGTWVRLLLRFGPSAVVGAQFRPFRPPSGAGLGFRLLRLPDDANCATLDELLRFSTASRALDPGSIVAWQSMWWSGVRSGEPAWASEWLTYSINATHSRAPSGSRRADSYLPADRPSLLR